MPSTLPRLTDLRVTEDFKKAFKKHLEILNWNSSEADYILTAVVEKMSSELDEDIPSPKAPHGVRMDARPSGWKSRLYADRYELVVLPDMTVKHLHEHPDHFPRMRKKFGMSLDDKNWHQANVYVHRDLYDLMLDNPLSPYFEDSTIGKAVRAFIATEEGLSDG